MSFLFACLRDFNEPIYKWNTTNVINMNGMFHDASSFNQVIDV